MTVSTLVRVLRDRWIHLVAGLAVGLLAAGAVCLFLPRAYASTSSLYVTAVGQSADPLAAYQGSMFTAQRMKSYTELVASDRVLGPVAERLALPVSPDALANEVSAAASVDSTILNVTVVDGDPQRAALIANASADRLVEVVTELESPLQPGAGPAVSISVVDRAQPPVDPERPQVALTLALGAVLGLLAGIAVALLRGVLDSRVRSSAELESSGGSPSLGSLPMVPALVGSESAPPLVGAYGEAVRRVRTNVLFASIDTPSKVIAVTSALPSEGKTTLVCAMAAAMAQNARVLVVEGDLRRPTIATRTGVTGTPGLADVLAGRVTPEQAIQRWAPYGVDVLVCGTVPPDPSELLSSQRARGLVDRLRAQYDVVLLDGPPLLPVVDGAVLASYADSSVLLCREGRTTTEQVARATAALHHVGARLAGVVLTMSAEADGAAYEGYFRYRGHRADRLETASH